MGTIIVTLFALALPTKDSTGAIVPLLIFADCFAVSKYYKTVNWTHFKRLMPSVIIGILLGVFIGDKIDDQGFKIALASIIIGSAIVMIILDRVDEEYIPKSLFFANFMGFGAGFTTMVGNLAGVFANVYFMALRIPKIQFISTTAILFFTINFVKLPFHIWVWETLDWEYLKLDLWFTPLIILGFYSGYWIIQRINEKIFRKYIIYMTILGGILILMK